MRKQNEAIRCEIAQRWPGVIAADFFALVEHEGRLFGHDGFGWLYWSESDSNWRWDCRKVGIESPGTLWKLVKE